ncbi:triacylglycerol lipase [Corynebacterium sp.]|uniref:esterase/lipase family protein n=1 Tax=Corynebacterium sp. TaxID=1720 RepID=UPI0026DB4BD4|nr:alpha/beta hydrolase [Corynebacterium sp.]
MAGFIVVGGAGTNAQAAPPPQGQVAPPAREGGEARHNQIAAGATPLVPEGVNDPECRVTPERPHAVILVHGTDASLYGDYSKLGAEIARDGWCAYGLDYGEGKDGRFGWGKLEDSARQLDELIRAARATSGAEKVQLVGFSQGATVARWWVNKIDHGHHTHAWIGLASPTRGGNLYGTVSLANHVPGLVESAEDAQLVAPALVDLREGSPVMEELNAGGETVPGPAYVTVSTRTDEMMPEWVNQPIFGERTRNIVQQDLCPANLGGHMYMTYNPTVTELTRFLLVDWQSGGSPGEVPCPEVALGAFLPELVVADKLQKLQPPERRRQAVTYSTTS